jgi:drug/metabolite transporter (DMT)-like permease
MSLSSSPSVTSSRRATWKVLLAFGIIYLVWGSTFLAIRIGVREVPPFLLAALRFSAAGLLLLGWTLMRGEKNPTAREWLSIGGIAFLIFVLDYGLLFWAEQRVPSGIAAVIMATTPAFTAVSEMILLKNRALTVRLAAALLIGLVGVAVLTGWTGSLGHAAVDGPGASAILIGALTWSIAGVLMKKLPLPRSKIVSAGAQMLVGSVLLAIAAAGLGEFQRFHPSAVSAHAWLALLYLTLAGSVAGFTAYVWLLHRESPTKVGTYAYVNPAIAVVIGYFLGGEPIGLQTILGSLLVLISVAVITTTRSPSKP